MGQAKLRRNEIAALKAGTISNLLNSILPATSTDFYTISVDLPPAELKAWLLERGCPKASSTVQAGDGYLSTFTMAGSLSVASAIGNFSRLGLRYESNLPVQLITDAAQLFAF
jgi:hypothetical protein